MASEPNPVIVEKSSSGPWMAVIALVALALVAIGGFSLIQSRNDKDTAIAGAAEKVGDAAKDVGDAAKDAVNK